MSHNGPTDAKAPPPNGLFKALSTAAREISAEVRRDLNNQPPSGYAGSAKPAVTANLPTNTLQSPVALASFGTSASIPDDVQPAEQTQSTLEENHRLQDILKNPWPALRQPDMAERLHSDAYFHPYTAADLEHYAKDILPATNPEIVSLIAVEAGEGPLVHALTKLFQQSPGVFGGLGYNPRNLQQDMDQMDATITGLLNRYPQFIAIGPIGIDANYSSTSIAQQVDQFIRQLEIAADFELPAIIFHNKAVDHLQTALARTILPRRIIWLKPIRTPEELELIHTIDAFVTLRAEITHPKENFYQQAITQILPQKLLFGSGNSLNAVHNQAGQFNSSVSLPEIARTTAKLIGTHPVTLQARINQNFAQAYGPYEG